MSTDTIDTQATGGHLNEESLSAYLDQELTQQQNQRVAQHLKHCSSCATKLAQLEQLSAGLQQERQRFQPLDLGDGATAPKQSSGLTKLTWWLLAVGGLPLIGYGLYLHWQSTAELSWWLRGALLCLLLGLVIGFIVVVKERIVARRTDKFRKVNL